MINKVKNFLKQIEESRKKEAKSVKNKYKDTENKFNLYLDLKEKGIKDIKEISTITCWGGGLQWCCASLSEKKAGLSKDGKDCIYRSMALDLLNWTDKDLLKYKKECGELINIK